MHPIPAKIHSRDAPYPQKGATLPHDLAHPERTLTPRQTEWSDGIFSTEHRRNGPAA